MHRYVGSNPRQIKDFFCIQPQGYVILCKEFLKPDLTYKNQKHTSLYDCIASGATVD